MFSRDCLMQMQSTAPKRLIAERVIAEYLSALD
jgi:hypothetical protein